MWLLEHIFQEAANIHPEIFRNNKDYLAHEKYIWYILMEIVYNNAILQYINVKRGGSYEDVCRDESGRT